MNSRERVELALSHHEPDRVPIDYWAQPEVTARLMRHLGLASREELLQELDVDFRYIEGPRYVGPRGDSPVAQPRAAVPQQQPHEEDHFGVPRVKVRVGAGESGGTYSEVASYPLAGMSLAQIEQYPKWPSPDWFDYSPVRSQVEAARATGKVVVFMGDRTNRAAQLKPAMYLRGVEQILLDMAAAPEIAHYIFHRVGAFYLEYFRRTLEAAGGGIDIFLTGDDFGTQTGLMVSPRMWTEFLRPGFEAFIRLGHEHGCRVAHHSCGSIKPIIGDMIDCGLDILNPLQPGVHDMDHAELKRLFGERLCFHGSISIQRTLPYGSADDIRREVRQRFDTLAPGGGFVFCTAHNIQPDTPTENVLTLFKACRELARYGL
jgi:uroporphyrinogen decarboxylase